MGQIVWGVDTIEVDLIDDAHADEISFHIQTHLGDELARVPTVGRAPIEYRWPGPGITYICAKVWSDGIHVATLDTRRLSAGDSYRINFGEPRAKPEPKLADEWRVSWTEVREWPEASQLRTDVFDAEWRARAWVDFLLNRMHVAGIRVEHRRVTPWDVIDPFTLTDESTNVDKPWS